MSLKQISKQNFEVLWQRSLKVIVPVAAVGGFIGDVLAPLGSFVAVLAILTGFLCVVSGVIWFGFKRRQIRRALLDGVIDNSEYEKIGATNAWSVAFAFNFVAAVVLTGFFGAQKALAIEPDRGVIASTVPGFRELQTRLLGLEEKLERVDAAVQRVEAKQERVLASTEKVDATTERIETKTAEMSQTLAALDAKVAGLNAAPAESAADAPTECPASQSLAPYGKVFESSDLRVEMATFVEKNEGGQNDVLLRIKGAPAFDAGIDGQAIRYKTRPGYGGGTDFVYNDQGREPTRMIFRRDPASDSDIVRVFLKDGKAYDLKFNAARSKSLCPSAIAK